MKETTQDRKTAFSVDLQTHGCPVCNHVIKIARDFFAQWQYALAYDEKAQSEFASELGFCAVHIWQLHELSSPLGESCGLTHLTKQIAEMLSGLERGSTAASRVQEILRTPESCRVCRMLATTEAAYIDRLAKFLANAKSKQIYECSQGVCLRHLTRLLAITADEDRRFLLSAAARRFEKLAERMHSYVVKRNATRRDLINSDEENAYLRALIRLAGAKDYSAP
jgi:Family of unknown function (DUF6062)